MPDNLISDARVRAERLKPAVRAAALLRIARVEAASDPGKARITFEMGLEAVRHLKGRDRQTLLEQARLLAAAVAPDLLTEIPDRTHAQRHMGSYLEGSVMLDHGHDEAAFHYVMDHALESFPFELVGRVMERQKDDERKLAVLRRSIEAWPFVERDWIFLMIVRTHAALLPAEEAEGLVRRVVAAALEQPDTPTHSSYGDEVMFTSSRENTLFQMVTLLRQFDEPYLESLVATHEELAAALLRYPNGLATMEEEAEEYRRNHVCESCGGFVMAGDPKDFPAMLARRKAEQDSDYGPSLEYAMEQYREDTAPGDENEAPREFWPSTCSFRNVLYQAGKKMGMGASQYLDEVPEEDLRVLAQIELAAALAGLPPLQATQRTYRAGRGRKGFVLAEDASFLSPDGLRVRCPQCEFAPPAALHWSCRCGHRWNTFETRGRCPGCELQWEVTQCLRCGEISPHEDWYLPPDQEP